MKRFEEWIDRLISSRLLAHVLFCGLFVLVFAISVILSGNTGVALAGMISCLFLLACTYAGRWCARGWLAAAGHGGFLHRLIPSIAVLTLAGASGSGWLFRSDGKAYFLHYLTVSFPLVVLFVFLGVSISLARNNLIRRINQAWILKEQKESELRLLLAQLSPHFLFNTLNNIYGLSLTEQQRVPDLLLKLSELLRYAVYESRQTFIPLKDELLYLDNYIEFEKIQTGDRLALTYRMDPIADDTFQIAPMVLIVFVENAFKYAKSTRSPRVFVSIRLQLKQDWICFTVENSYDPLQQARARQGRLQQGGSGESSGIGLHHTLKRLNLIYGKDYTCAAHAVNGTYRVELSLKAPGKGDPIVRSGKSPGGRRITV